MKHLFLSYELALKAKGAGFDENTLRFWQTNDGMTVLMDNFFNTKPTYLLQPVAFTNVLAAPLYQQVIDWLRESYDIWIYQQPQFDGVQFQFHTWLYWRDDVKDLGICFNSKQTYIELDKAIEQAFILIPQTKQP